MTVSITSRARTWIASGAGGGTYTLWAHMMGIRSHYVGHPHDKGDLRRVMELLAAVPEWEARVPEMASISPEWAIIASSWPDLKTSPDRILKLFKQPRSMEERLERMFGTMTAHSHSRKENWTEVLSDYAELSLDDRINSWIVGGDVGLSSKTVWATMLGISLEDGEVPHPHDPADLGRCLRLLEVIPEWKPRLGELASLSPEWKALICRWDEVATSMETEVGIAWQKAKSAPATYAMMKSILDKTQRS